MFFECSYLIAFKREVNRLFAICRSKVMIWSVRHLILQKSADVISWNCWLQQKMTSLEKLWCHLKLLGSLYNRGKFHPPMTIFTDFRQGGNFTFSLNHLTSIKMPNLNRVNPFDPRGFQKIYSIFSKSFRIFSATTSIQKVVLPPLERGVPPTNITWQGLRPYNTFCAL